MDQVTFIAAALSLLATPGPTNTLLATSGAETGLCRSLPLLGAELGGYLLAILLLRALIGPLMAANPNFAMALHGAVVVYLLYLAFALWRRGARQINAGGAITFPRVFVTTLLNPKAIIFSFTLLPKRGDIGELAPWLSMLSLQIVTVGLGWILLGHMLRGRFREPGFAHVGYRISALILVGLAGMIGGHSLSLA
ncbi:LysE family transporter [Rhodoblastus sp.]|jgi:threonine/homoserine/homoserine lactone efflux protein|uniref:LysE family translocator n=1 Tax=Rhodoblastus sp. TaxID=1962975 RepID=UPI0025FCA5BE|nr:LysE family transporter [Rhodoblastus sp.]